MQRPVDEPFHFQMANRGRDERHAQPGCGEAQDGKNLLQHLHRAGVKAIGAKRRPTWSGAGPDSIALEADA